MAKYLHQLRQGVFPDGPILLILDTYAAHRSAEVRAVARDLGIDLIFIPLGCTDLV
jgi:transposase